MAKYGNWTQGQFEALINILGEENALALIQGDVEVTFQLCARKFFDKNGRRIPPRGLVAAVCDSNPNYRLNQPNSDYAGRLARLQQAGFTVGISADEFEARTSALLSVVEQNEQIKNLLKGVYLPIVIQQQMNIANLGEVTEKLVEAAGASYCRQFPNRSFTNHRKGELAGQISIVEGSRYERLIKKIASDLVVGIYFPACLQGFSVHAQREQATTLPEGFILSGPLETAMGWTMYPDVLGRDWNTPGYDCSAVQWRSADYSLGFKADGGRADFALKTNLGSAYGPCSGGLFILG